MASEPLGSGFQTLGDEGNGLIIKSFSPSFLPVQDSSIGDLVTQSVITTIATIATIATITTVTTITTITAITTITTVTTMTTETAI